MNELMTEMNILENLNIKEHIISLKVTTILLTSGLEEKCDFVYIKFNSCQKLMSLGRRKKSGFYWVVLLSAHAERFSVSCMSNYSNLELAYLYVWLKWARHEKNILYELRKVQLFFLDFPPNWSIFPPILDPWTCK